MVNSRELKKYLDTLEQSKKNCSAKLSFTKKSISSDRKISFSQGKGKSTIKITNSCNILIEYISNKILVPELVIDVEKNCTVNLVEVFSNKNVFRKLQVNVSNDSSLNVTQFIKQGSFIETNYTLNKNSKVNHSSAYYLDNCDCYISTKSTHIGEFSESYLEINGAVKNKSRVINDGLVNIQSNAFKSKGHQNMKNYILDSDSIITSEPILQIYNGDVECSHGSSISKPNQDTLFYLNSRGLSESKSINLIVDGLFESLSQNLENFPFSSEIFLEK